LASAAQIRPSAVVMATALIQMIHAAHLVHVIQVGIAVGATVLQRVAIAALTSTTAKRAISASVLAVQGESSAVLT
jgi:hypothetical protein